MKRTFLFTSVILSGALILSISTLFNSCKSPSTTGYALTGDTIADGKALVQQHCTKCHALVPVNALTKDVWTVHTLPSMAHYFSVKTYGIDYYKDDGDTTGLSLINWQAIVAYYKKAAPDTLTAAKAPSALLTDWAGFVLKKPARSNDICFTTMITTNPASGKIYTSDAVSNNLTEWDSQLKITKAVQLPSMAVGLEFLPDSAGIQQAIISCIGRLDAVDFPNGKVMKVNLTNEPELKELHGDLPRPVQTLTADFDKDGQNETVICGQGALKGGVYLLKFDKAKKTYGQTSITDRPGAVQVITGDFNKDGWPDMMVLYGSTDEGLVMYLNNKKRRV